MSNGSEHTPERCVHAVDGPDWAGLRELYPAEVDYKALVVQARALVEAERWTGEVGMAMMRVTALADAVESLLAIEQRLTDHIVQLAAERDALQARLDAMTERTEWGVRIGSWPTPNVYQSLELARFYAARPHAMFEEYEHTVVTRSVWSGPWTVVPEGDTNA